MENKKSELIRDLETLKKQREFLNKDNFEVFKQKNEIEKKIHEYIVIKDSLEEKEESLKEKEKNQQERSQSLDRREYELNVFEKDLKLKQLKVLDAKLGDQLSNA